MPEPRIRVLIVDDHALARAGYRLTLASQPDIDVVGEASSGEEAIQLVTATRPDVVTMDVRMPGMGGIEATRAITKSNPGSRVIVLTTFDLDEYAFEGLRAGASAFLVKSAPPERLVDAVRTVADGHAVVEARITQKLVEHFITTENGRGTKALHEVPENAALLTLTQRERDIFIAIVRGWSNPEIAERLHLSPSTVKSYVNQVFTKLHIRDRVQAVILGYELGLVDEVDR